MAMSVLSKAISKKKKLAKKLCTNKELLLEIEEQICVCEELGKPLTETVISKLCGMSNTIQIENYCRVLKKC